MTLKEKRRIDQLRHGIVPEGYKRTKVGICPEDWVENVLGDIYTERKEPGKEGLPLLMVSIHSGVSDGEVGEKDLPKRFKRIEDKSQYKRAVVGDLVFNMMRAWQGAIGSVRTEGMVSPAYVVAKPNDMVDPLFMDYYMKTNRMVHTIHRQSYGVTDFRLRLYWESFAPIPCVLPPAREQKKIAEILTTQDKVIELEQQKIEEIMKVKRFFLEKMFPKKGKAVPEIRFKGFTDPWEQRKLGELPEKTYGGGTPSTTNVDYWNGNIPWLQSSDISEGKLFDVTPKKFISQSGLNDSAAQLVPENSIAIITRVGVGKLAFLPFSYTTSQDFLSMSRLTTAPYFTVYACYKKLQSELNSVQGTSIKGITKDELLAKEIKVPSYEEQKRIGEYFCSLDRLITLHQRKLEEEKKKKKALMQLLLTGIVRV